MIEVVQIKLRKQAATTCNNTDGNIRLGGYVPADKMGNVREDC